WSNRRLPFTATSKGGQNRGTRRRMNAFARMASLRSIEAFQNYLTENKIAIPCDSELSSDSSPLAQPLLADGLSIGNRFFIPPMEGWDGTTGGAPTELTIRRWRRFGASGAKCIWGGEAVAVREDGRANPNQLLIKQDHCSALEQLRRVLVDEHRAKVGS